MRRIGALAGLMLALGVLAIAPVSAQPAEGGSALMVVMDASGSMLADDGAGRTKLDGAKGALRNVVKDLPDGAVTGLLVYGHRTSSDAAAKAAGCQDTEVVVPPAPLDRGRMTAAIDGYAARGYTPIGKALQDAVAALPTSGKQTVLLVSDGVDTCAPPDPCTVARGLRGAGVDLQVQTVGFQVDPAARAQLQCIAQATGGAYSDATDSAGLSSRLVDIASRAARSYQAQGTAVKGGASTQDAPVLEPGRYTDSIVNRESIWYAADVEAGQELTARATIVANGVKLGIGSGGGVGTSWQARMFGPDFTQLPGQDAYAFQANFSGNATVQVRSGTVGAPGGSGPKPGRYYVKVETSWVGDAQAELPIELVLEVTQPGPTPPTATATSGPAAPPSASASPPAQASTLTPILFGVIGVLALMVIGLGIAVVVLLRRVRS